MTDRGGFATKLVELMKGNKVTTAKLSAATGISEITINKLRNGQNSNPTISTVVAITKYFGVSNDYLINDPETQAKKTLNVTNLDSFGVDYEKLSTDEFFGTTDFAVKITNKNYADYQHNSILLLSKDNKFNNEDVVLVKLNDKCILCRLIIEGGVYIGKSLTISDKYYEIGRVENILGVVTGVIWKKS